MLREGPIPPALQGLLEYLAGFLFIAAPFLLDFTDSGVATAASIVFGIAFLVLAATSQGPAGLVKQLSPPVHALLDAVLAILLIAAPFVLGFSAEPTPRNLFLIAGVVWLLVTIGSRYGSGRKERSAAPTPHPAVAAPAPEGVAPQLPPGGGAPDLGAAAGGRTVPGTMPGSAGTTPGSAGTTPGSVDPEYGPLDGGSRPD
jgi:hypothetical protein